MTMRPSLLIMNPEPFDTGTSLPENGCLLKTVKAVDLIQPGSVIWVNPHKRGKIKRYLRNFETHTNKIGSSTLPYSQTNLQLITLPQLSCLTVK